MRTLRILPALAVIVLLLAACGSDSGDQPTAAGDATEQAAGDAEGGDAEGGAAGVNETVSPEPGGEPVVVTGTVAEGTENLYTVEFPTFGTGETMYARVISGDVTLSVRGADGQSLESGVTDATIDLVEEGPLTVAVESTGGSADYELEIGVAVSAS